MEHPVIGPIPFEAVIGAWIRVIGIGIEIFGVVIIVAGIAWATSRFLQRRMEERHYGRYKVRIGRSLLLGLEMLVAADIVKTIALEPSFAGLGVLAGLVVVRTFLSWTLVLEIEGRWPWQAEATTDETIAAGHRNGAAKAFPSERAGGQADGAMAPAAMTADGAA